MVGKRMPCTVGVDAAAGMGAGAYVDLIQSDLGTWLVMTTAPDSRIAAPSSLLAHPNLRSSGLPPCWY